MHPRCIRCTAASIPEDSQWNPDVLSCPRTVPDNPDSVRVVLQLSRTGQPGQPAATKQARQTRPTHKPGNPSNPHKKRRCAEKIRHTSQSHSFLPPIFRLQPISGPIPCLPCRRASQHRFRMPDGREALHPVDCNTRQVSRRQRHRLTAI